ncbi:uncharacterized protein MISP3 isoform X1 [Python bivittatus]|uniref:Uncharacterized protein MISP3 isoform X1 n=1 Tax=Python bivittatus TaxID=176946 RepID=A0A9F2R411_PYTBI|nr:uncharacterized protein MISP3 isoform X1 [Python bivittatus]XP_025027137.1 uncharacterized protein MISP3 isoform X1 [Python bivittatus]
MNTEALFLSLLDTGVGHSNQESSAVDEFRQMVGSKDMAKDVSITTEPNNPLIPPLEDANSLIAKKNALEASSNPIQKDAPVKKASSSPVLLSQGINMAPVYQGQDDSQIKMPNISSEQQKEENTLRQLAQGETGSHLKCHDNILNVFPELKHSDGISIQEVQGVESRLYHCSDKAPIIPADDCIPLECVQEAKKNIFVPDGATSDIASEQQTSNDVSNQPDQKIQDDTVDHSIQSPDAYSGSAEKPELSSSPKQTPACEEKSEALGSPKSVNLLPLGTNSQNQTREGECFISNHSNFDLTAELQGIFHPTNIHEQIKPSCQEITEIGNEVRVPSGQNHQLLLASEDNQGHVNGQFLRKSLEDNSQTTEEQVTQDSSCSPNSSSLASADSQLDVDSCCQQRASGTGCDPLPQKLPAQSPVATNDSCGPAHQGLAPVCDRQDRERLAIHESRGAGNNNQSQGEVGAESVLESERQKEETRDSESGENTSQPEGAENLADPNKLDKAFPDSQSLPNTIHPTNSQEAMVLASAEDLLGARNGADSQGLANAAYPDIATEYSGSNPTPRERLRLDAADSTNTRNLVSPADPTPAAEEHSVTEGSDCPTDLMGNNTHQPENPSHTTETPIEREIRVHLEREELLRRERGLASSRGTQEYVEVCIKPILNQSMTSCIKPKEKERQWAGVQMQREIQRECRREEDLVQLGKVRGTYDRGTPQELQEKKMIFEQHSSPEIPDFRKMVYSSNNNSIMEGARGPSFAEVNRMPNVIVLDSGVPVQPQQHMPERASLGSPFFCLRAKSSQSLLEQEVQEVQERERELWRQRHALYGSALPCQPAEDSDQVEEVPYPPERPSCKKLDVTWPPPSTSENVQVNSLHQVERSPRLLRRQRNALIQRWESGAIGSEESQD